MRSRLTALLRVLGGYVALAWIALSVVAVVLHWDDIRLGMLLTYPPRLVYALIAAWMAVRALARRRRGVAAAAAVVALAAGWQIGWGGAAATASPAELTLLSFNIHNAVDHAPALAEYLARADVDFVSLQEVRPENRKYFVEALPRYRFFWADETLTFEHSHWGGFASMTGVRRDLLGDAAALVDSGITDYRTFATRVSTPIGRLWVVNVHTTKAFWVHNGVTGVFSRGADKAAWHFEEREQLGQWIRSHSDEPVVVGGDFNAPYNAHNLRLPGMSNAHLEAGRGPHLTFPRWLPIWGIDHTLGNEHVAFHEYLSVDMGFSDHRAQLVRFSIGAGRI